MTATQLKRQKEKLFIQSKRVGLDKLGEKRKAIRDTQVKLLCLRRAAGIYL